MPNAFLGPCWSLALGSCPFKDMALDTGSEHSITILRFSCTVHLFEALLARISYRLELLELVIASEWKHSLCSLSLLLCALLPSTSQIQWHNCICSLGACWGGPRRNLVGSSTGSLTAFRISRANIVRLSGLSHPFIGFAPSSSFAINCFASGSHTAT